MSRSTTTDSRPRCVAARGDSVSGVTLPFRSFTLRRRRSAPSSSRWRTRPGGARSSDYRCANRGAVERRIGRSARSRGRPGPGSSGGSRTTSRSVARRQVGGVHPELQRRRARRRVRGHRRCSPGTAPKGNMYTHASIVWSPDSQEAGGLSGDPGLPAGGPLRPVLSGRPASAQDRIAPLRQAGRRARPEAAGGLRRASGAADACRRIAVPQRLRAVRAGVEEGRAAPDLRVQPARPSGLPDHRGRRRDGRDPRGRQRGAEDLLLLPTRAARNSATTSTTGARSSGCRSGTAGTTSTSTTARRGR